jgi:hypothetical protein
MRDERQCVPRAIARTTMPCAMRRPAALVELLQRALSHVVKTIMRADVGTGLCPTVFEALEVLLMQQTNILQVEPAPQYLCST